MKDDNHLDDNNHLQTEQQQKREPWIRGVNIGGWLVLERYITPYFFALTDCDLRGDFHFYPGQIDAPPTSSPLYKPMFNSSCKPVPQPYPVDEYTLSSAFGSPNNSTYILKKYLAVHWDNFVQRTDLESLKAAGITHVRVPMGHWITGNIRDDEPFVDGGWTYFQRLVQWCREIGIQVVADLHTAPGSQNGFDNSGQLLDVPSCDRWDSGGNSSAEGSVTVSVPPQWSHIMGSTVVLSKNVLRTLDIIDEITTMIVNDDMTDVVTGFGILNEPFQCNIQVLKKFNDLALNIVRKNMGENVQVYIHDRFDPKIWTGMYNKKSYKDTFLDSHYYQVFEERYRGLSPRQHIALVCQKSSRELSSCCHGRHKATGKRVPSTGISRIVGEWSVSFDSSVGEKISDIMTSIAQTGEALEFDRQLSTKRKEFLRNYAKAQMVTYEAADSGISSGWFYWSFKMEGGAFAEWDFLRGVTEGWMPSVPLPHVPSAVEYGSCYDILLQTSDDESVVHEFPVPTPHKIPPYERGSGFDDDVVIAHGNNLRKDADGHWHIMYHPMSVHIGVVVGAAILTLTGIIRLKMKRRKREVYVPIDGDSERTYCGFELGL